LHEIIKEEEFIYFHAGGGNMGLLAKIPALHSSLSKMVAPILY